MCCINYIKFTRLKVTFMYLTMYAKHRVCLQCYAGDTYTLIWLASYFDQQATPASGIQTACNVVL